MNIDPKDARNAIRGMNNSISSSQIGSTIKQLESEVFGWKNLAEDLAEALEKTTSIGNNGYVDSDSITLMQAMSVLRVHLRDDPDYRQTWIANIAGAIYDTDQNLITEHEWREACAERFLAALCNDGSTKKTQDG